MRKIKTLALLSFTMLVMFGTVSAQPWMTEFDSKNGEPSFYEIQDAFNDYWAKRDYEKGKGFKQFKRWENFMEPRVDKNGYFPHYILTEEWRKVKKQAALSTRGEMANWEHMGPDDTPVDINSPTWRRGSGRLNCISFHPTDADIMFVGAPSGGFWKTLDGGLSWETTTDHLPSIGVSDIAVHPTDPNIIFIATGDGDARDTYSAGILKSTNMGDTWDHVMLDLAIQDQIIIRRLIINPNNPNILIAASSAGILYTSNAGVDWEVRASGHFKDVEFKPGNPDYVYASTYEYSGAASIYRSENGGMNWTSVHQISEANRIEIAVTPDDANRIYAVASDASSNGYLGFYKSTNSGNSWTEVHDNSSLNLLGWSSDGSDSGGQGWYDLAIAADPNNADNVFVGGVNTWKSSNAGSSWNISTHWYGDNAAYVHADQHTLDYHPLTGALFSGNDGGLHITTNNGSNWTDLSDGLQILQIYRFGNSVTNPNRFVTGSQDNGSMRYDNGDWRAILGGDGMECLIDYTNDQILYASYYYGAIHRSTNGGQDFTNVQPVEAGEGAWVTPYVIDPIDPQTLYAGFSDVYKTTNRGSTWNPISNNLTGGTNLQSLAVASSNPDVIYAATYDNIYRTENGGGTWGNVTNNLPNNSITYITVNPSNPNMLWVSLSGFSSGEKIYYSDNGGNSWTNYSEGLPNVPANCLVYELGTNHALYAGTDLGVFYRNAGMSEWIPYSQGLPNVIVNELEIQYDVNKLRAATYGRGVWESDLFELVAPPVADFSHNIINGCEGVVQFASISSGAPDEYRWEFGDGTQSFEFSPTHIYEAIGDYDVKLWVSNALGEDSITQTISLNPTVPLVDFSSDVSNGCDPTEVEFYNLSGNALSFLWEFGDGETSNDFEPLHTYTEPGLFDVKLTAYTTLCPETSVLKANYINFDPLNTSELNMPEDGYGPDQVCCEGTLYDNGGPDGMYSNNTNGSLKIKPANADQIEFQFLEFDVEAGSASECDYDRITIYDGEIPYAGYAIGEFCNTNPPSGTYITEGENALVKQYTDPGVTEQGFKLVWQCLFVDYTYEADETNYKSFAFTDISTNYPDSWAWDFGDGNTSSDQNPQHTFAQDGIYDVSLTVTNAQGDYTETKSINVGDVNVETNSVDESIKIYPNPVASGTLFVQFIEREKNPLSYEIFSIDGKLIKRGEIKESKTTFSISLDGFTSGIYTLKLTHGKARFVRQFNKL
jgi:PKD repeat protein